MTRPTAASSGVARKLEQARYVLDQAARRWYSRYVADYAFVHINKTGGSSIERALRLPFEHKTAAEKIAELGADEWARRYTFTVVRNPWDKVVSHYHYRVQTNQTGLGARPLPFGDWVRLAYRDHDPAYYDQPRMFMPQADWITGPDGGLLVDEVCRFETLAADFAAVCRRIGTSAAIPHEKPSRRGPYREHYDDAAAEIVREAFARDIERFHYQF